MSGSQADIGLIGLAVMGQNLVLNIEEHGFRVAVYNRTAAVTREFCAGAAAGRAVIGCEHLEELVGCLTRPRRIVLLVKAGAPVDRLIEGLEGLLEAGDIVIDGGNSHYQDTERRWRRLAGRGLRYVGTGVSGGEEGARRGPSLMPGGDPAAWPEIRDLFQAICARAEGEPCCQWVGEGGAGHFVKMVHNGIEYGDMQLICEAYHLLGEGLGLDNDAMAAVFGEWNRGELDSYLVEITAEILAYRDAGGSAVLDRILDAAGQKGTGRWTVVAGLELGAPVSLIGEAVFARSLSALDAERARASEQLGGPEPRHSGPPEPFIEDLRQALYAAKIVSYAQGFMLLREAARAHGWTLDHGDIALMWRGGCIIRSAFLGSIRDAYARDPRLDSLLLAPFFRDALARCQPGWRRVVAAAAMIGIPVPALGSALAFLDGYRRRRLPANLLQAQRDYFGAHTYERLDRPRGEHFHTDWTGRGGAATSGAYEG